MADDQPPRDSDLLGLEVAGIAVGLLFAVLIAFFFVGPVAGIVVLLAIAIIGFYWAYKRFGNPGG